MQNENHIEVEQTLPSSDAPTKSIQARPAFKVQTINAGIMVSALSTNQEGQELLIDGQLLPAIFPTLSDALNHVDQLRNLIVQHFENAAQVGMRVIGNSNEQDVMGVEFDTSTASKRVFNA